MSSKLEPVRRKGQNPWEIGDGSNDVSGVEPFSFYQGWIIIGGSSEGIDMLGLKA